MNLNDVLRRFPDARQSGAGWSARCPAHDDRSPSLSIAEGDDGRVLLHCHSGCSPDAVVRAKGMSMSDLMPERTDGAWRRSAPSRSSGYATPEEATAGLEKKHGPVAKVWQYLDANGCHVGSILRWNGRGGKKVIRPISLEGGTWRPGGMPSPRPLYGLPDLADAPRVFVTEGEKAADAARLLGLVATTSAHGSQSASKTDWTPLAGKEVVILPDNDAAGADYAMEVLRMLSECEPRPSVKIVALPGLAESGDIADLVEAAGSTGLDALLREVEVAVESVSPVEFGPAAIADGDKKPTVWLATGQKPRITDQSLAVLARDHFNRGGQIVRCSPSPAGVRIVPVTQEAIDDTLNRRIRFASLEQDKDGNTVEIDAASPGWLSKNIVALQNWPGIRELESVHCGPFIRADGSVGGLHPGYDSDSRCWVDTAEDWSELCAPPTEQEAKQAVATLLEIIDEFPFVGEADKSAWLAALLTRVARSAFQGPSPLFVITATTPGSGKTMLAKMIGVIAEGQSPGMRTLSKNEEENKKMITSALHGGAGMLVFDNVAGQIKSGVLDGFLTSEHWTDRILGKTQEVTLPNLTVSILTTNNATIQGDTARRSIAVRLAPLEERPERRVFRIPDLERHVRENRRRLLVAAIRVMQWHVVSGRPQRQTYRHRDADGNDIELPVAECGSFAAWSALVRQAVMGVGLPDPLATCETIQVADEGRAACRALLESWVGWNPDWTGTARQLIEVIYRDSATVSGEILGMRDAICELVGDGGCQAGRPTPTALGNCIRRMQGRNFANLRIESMGHAASGTRWRVVRVTS